MNTKTFALLTTLCFTFQAAAIAAPTSTYQVTGPILEMTDSMIAVQKGKDRWELARDSSTKANKDLKVGDKVTVTYRMTATQIEGKPGKAEKAPAKATEKASDKTATADATSSPTPRPAGSPKRDF